MVIGRTLRALTVFSALFVVLAASPALASADADEAATSQESEPEVVFDPTDPEQVFREIVFPVVGSVSYFSGFGDCRDGCTRLHRGIDISTFGWKGLPVVAAHDGTVISTRTGGELSGCSVAIRADDGWTTRYIHLNTDTPQTDDGRYACFAPSIEVGARIKAGTVIGWIGDSGNAEHTVPNLHFEIRNPDDIAVDPWVSLEAAQRIDHEWVNAQSVLDLTTSLFDDEAGTVIVVDAANLPQLAAQNDGPTVIDVPLVPYDTDDPIPALTALRELSPERIVILAGSDSQRLADVLQTYAPIVAVGVLAGLEPTEVSSDDTLAPETPPMTLEALETDRFTTLIGGRLASIADSLRKQIETLGFHHKIVILSASRAAPSGVGFPANGRPAPDANRDVLWWNTSSGWMWSDSVEEAPDPGLAYVDEDHANEATTAYLMSQAAAPAMPLWHYQSISRATRSL
ncbi:MAG: M23 family metallopeptidase [Acidimicrobiia bacterium]